MNNPNKVLFLDIETASNYKSFSEFEKKNKELYKILYLKKKEDIKEFYEQKAGLSPVYGRITCLSMAYYLDDELVMKTFTGEEKTILEESYKGFVNASRGQYSICGYNVLNFDIPWLNVKMIKHGIEVPHILSNVDKKPWEMNVFDIYSQLNMKSMSLAELAYEFGVSVPVLNGIEMNTFYWNNEIDKIIEHCESDVKSTAEIYKLIYNKKQKPKTY